MATDYYLDNTKNWFIPPHFKCHCLLPYIVTAGYRFEAKIYRRACLILIPAWESDWSSNFSVWHDKMPTTTKYEKSFIAPLSYFLECSPSELGTCGSELSKYLKKQSVLKSYESTLVLFEYQDNVGSTAKTQWTPIPKALLHRVERLIEVLNKKLLTNREKDVFEFRHKHQYLINKCLGNSYFKSFELN